MRAHAAEYHGVSIDPSNPPTTVREYYLNPNTGFADKGHQSTPGTGSNSYTTQLNDLSSRVIGANWRTCASSPESSLSQQYLGLSGGLLMLEGSLACFLHPPPDEDYEGHKHVPDDFQWIFRSPADCGCGPAGDGPRKKSNCMYLNVYGKGYGKGFGHTSIGESHYDQVGFYSDGYRKELDFTNVIAVFECCCLSDKEHEEFLQRINLAKAKCGKKVGKKLRKVKKKVFGEGKDIDGEPYDVLKNSCHIEVLEIAEGLGCPNLSSLTSSGKKVQNMRGSTQLKYLRSKYPYCKQVGQSGHKGTDPL